MVSLVCRCQLSSREMARVLSIPLSSCPWVGCQADQVIFSYNATSEKDNETDWGLWWGMDWRKAAVIRRNGFCLCSTLWRWSCNLQTNRSWPSFWFSEYNVQVFFKKKSKNMQCLLLHIFRYGQKEVLIIYCNIYMHAFIWPFRKACLFTLCDPPWNECFSFPLSVKWDVCGSSAWWSGRWKYGKQEICSCPCQFCSTALW